MLFIFGGVFWVGWFVGFMVGLWIFCEVFMLWVYGFVFVVSVFVVVVIIVMFDFFLVDVL